MVSVAVADVRLQLQVSVGDETFLRIVAECRIVVLVSIAIRSRVRFVLARISYMYYCCVCHILVVFVAMLFIYM